MGTKDSKQKPQTEEVGVMYRVHKEGNTGL